MAKEERLSTRERIRARCRAIRNDRDVTTAEWWMLGPLGRLFDESFPEEPVVITPEWEAAQPLIAAAEAYLDFLEANRPLREGV